MEQYVGLDVSLKMIAISIVDRTGKIKHEGVVASDPEAIAKGGRVIADWPGLKTNQLYQGRDLAPTTDLRAVTKGLLADLFRRVDAGGQGLSRFRRR